MNNFRQTRIIGLPLVVIVAEKHPVLRASLAALLGHDGHRVFQAEDMNTTISCINRINDFSLLLSDLDMPGWKSILQHALTTAPDAFVIPMAGVEPLPKISDLQHRRVKACLQKPVIYNDVRQAISESLVRRRAA